MTPFADLDWSRTYDLDVTGIEPLTGGMIHRNSRLHTIQGLFVAKLYVEGPEADSTRLNQVYSAQEWVRSQGLSAVAVRRNRDGDVFTSTDDGAIVVTEYVVGTQPAGHDMSPAYAEAMGETLGLLLKCMEGLPAAIPSLPAREPVVGAQDMGAAVERIKSLLTLARARPGADAVDETAPLVLRDKLAKLEGWSLPLPVPPTQWIHGDYQSTNVIFGSDGKVAGIIDFDNTRPGSRAHEVTRAMDFSFPEGSERYYDFFTGFARTSGVTEDEAATYPVLRYFYSLMSVWPIAPRYEAPELYQPRWDVFITPPSDWWEQNLSPMREKLVEIARTARLAM